VLPRLLRLDPHATLSLGFVNYSLDFDFASAIANIEHARAHGFANVAGVEFHKAIVRHAQGWFDEAAALMQGAINAGLGQNDALGHCFVAETFWLRGRFAEALTWVDRALESAVPNWHRGRMLRLRITHFMGNTDEAKRDLEEIWTLFGESERASFPSVFAALGQPELARTILRENDLAWREGRLHTASYSFSGHHYLGELDQAFVWLNRAVDNREWWQLPFLRSKLFYANLRDDPRFDQVMRRIEAIEATPSPTQSIATGGGVSA
jgi:tetratricopeptide (TPR) repeat protein